MLAYCDWIADQIKQHFTNDKAENLITQVGPVKMDLHPTEGYFVSTKKTIEVMDINNKRYKVTIEEL